MTNYNERLDEVLTELCKNTQVDYGYEKLVPIATDKANQAITSLIKELVEEAKPEYISPDQPLGLKYQGRNEAIQEFEQNLLKVLEEV